MKMKLILIILILLIPTASAYPITDIDVNKPDDFVAGNNHTIAVDYFNEHYDPVDTQLMFNVSDVNSYSELDLSLTVNDRQVPVNETELGKFVSDEFKSQEEDNTATLDLMTNIALKPMVYEYNITLRGEHVEPVDWGGGGGGFWKPISTPTPTPTAEPTAQPTASPTQTPEKTPTEPEPTPTTQLTSTPEESPTPEKTPEQWIPGIPGFGTVAAVTGLLVAVIYLSRRR